MDKRSKTWRTAIELGKDLLILLLACSALWMIGLWQNVSLPRGQSPIQAGQQSAGSVPTGTARPMAIVVTLRGGERPARVVLQYDEEERDTLYQGVAGLLMETLSSAGQPEKVTRHEWEDALARAPGFLFDFQGRMPLSVLAGYLDVPQDLSAGVARRLLLTVKGDSVALYYHDLTDESWYCRTTQVVGANQLENAMEGLSADGSYYAFESEDTDRMARYTLLRDDPAPLLRYTAVNPVSGGRSALEGLMEDLNFNLSGCVFYSAAGEEVARSGSDTIRLSTAGVLEYHGDEESTQQFPVNPISGRSQAFAAVESCRQLLHQGVSPRCGQARLYLARVEQTAQGWQVEFEYALNGVGVGLQSGPAAGFTIQNGRITGFTIRLRSYAQGEEEQLILPPVQAHAAMGALSLEGRELRLMYRDNGEETVVPNWTAVTDEAG